MSAAFDALLAWVPADVLVSRLERELRAAGAGFDDIDERIAAELGVPMEAWLGYLTVKSAADHYQQVAARQERCDAGQRK